MGRKIKGKKKGELVTKFKYRGKTKEVRHKKSERSGIDLFWVEDE